MVASAILLVLSFPLGEQGYLGWFVFVPLLKALKGKGFLPAVAAVLITIFLASQISIWGWFYSVKDPAGDPGWVRTGFFIFGLAVCVPVGIWGDRGSAGLRTWWFAGIATLMEAFLMVQLPVHIALTQYRNVVVLQVAAIGGVWLLSFLMWWCNFHLAEQPVRKTLKIALLVIPMWLVAGLFHYHLGGPQAQFGIVQTAELEEEPLLKLHQLASKNHPDFVVWPEFAGMPWAFGGDAHQLAELSRKPGNAPILTSYPDASKPLPYNTAALFWNGERSNVYRKRRLFGGEASMHQPGTQASAAAYAHGKVGLNICFDSCYPETIRDTARIPGVNVIAVPAIDPYATNDLLSAVHAAYSPLRAAEEGVSIVRCDGHAFSQFVDPYGQIISQVLPGNRAATASLPIGIHWTLYRQFGDWFLYGLGIAVAGALAQHLRELRSKRQKTAQASPLEA